MSSSSQGVVGTATNNPLILPDGNKLEVLAADGAKVRTLFSWNGVDTAVLGAFLAYRATCWTAVGVTRALTTNGSLALLANSILA